MPLDAIRKNILADAESKAEAIESEAAKESARILKEAQDEANSMLKGVQAESKKEAERLRKESEAGLETESNTMAIQARGAVIEHVLSSVVEDIKKSLERDSMEKILNASIKQFSELNTGEDFVVIASKKYSSMLNGKNYSTEYGAINGFMLYTKDRKIALNATIDNIVERNIDTIRKLVASEVFTSRDFKMPKAASSSGGRSKRAKPAKKASK